MPTIQITGSGNTSASTIAFAKPSTLALLCCFHLLYNNELVISFTNKVFSVFQNLHLLFSAQLLYKATHFIFTAHRFIIIVFSVALITHLSQTDFIMISEIYVCIFTYRCQFSAYDTSFKRGFIIFLSPQSTLFCAVQNFLEYVSYNHFLFSLINRNKPIHKRERAYSLGFLLGLAALKHQQKD